MREDCHEVGVSSSYDDGVSIALDFPLKDTWI